MIRILATFIFICLATPLFAQLVNIEKKRKEYKEGFQGKISFSFNIIQNTSKITQGANTSHLQFIKNKHTFLLLNDYTLMKVEKDSDNFDLVNKNFQHFRYNYSIIDTNKLNLELFFQRQQNKIKFLEMRLLSGAGLRIKLIDNKFMTWYIAPLAMYEKEVLSDSLSTVTEMLKGDIYMSLGVNITDNVHFSNVTYYQPALLDFRNMNNFEPINDFRLFSESSLSFIILKNLEYSMVFELAYDSRPPTELINQPLFYNFKNKLSYKF